MLDQSYRNSTIMLFQSYRNFIEKNRTFCGTLFIFPIFNSFKHTLFTNRIIHETTWIFCCSTAWNKFYFYTWCRFTLTQVSRWNSVVGNRIFSILRTLLSELRLPNSASTNTKTVLQLSQGGTNCSWWCVLTNQNLPSHVNQICPVWLILHVDSLFVCQ